MLERTSSCRIAASSWPHVVPGTFPDLFIVDLNKLDAKLVVQIARRLGLGRGCVDRSVAQRWLMPLNRAHAPGHRNRAGKHTFESR
jgi:hypothetical protein